MTASTGALWRARSGVALLVVTALLLAFGVMPYLLQSGFRAPRGPDAITAFDRRLAPVQAALSNQGIVGYLPPHAADATDAAAHLYLTRYVLAPVLVLNDPTQAVLVADGVRDPAQLPPTLELVRDFGGGLLLLRQRPR